MWFRAHRAVCSLLCYHSQFRAHGTVYFIVLCRESPLQATCWGQLWMLLSSAFHMIQGPLSCIHYWPSFVLLCRKQDSWRCVHCCLLFYRVRGPQRATCSLWGCSTHTKVSTPVKSRQAWNTRQPQLFSLSMVSVWDVLPWCGMLSVSYSHCQRCVWDVLYWCGMLSVSYSQRLVCGMFCKLFSLSEVSVWDVL